jgi:hypothetical protein
MNAARSGSLRRSVPAFFGEHAGCPSAEGSGRLFQNLERYLAADLLNVLEAEVPNVDAALVGLALAVEARRRGRRGESTGEPRL